MLHSSRLLVLWRSRQICINRFSTGRNSYARFRKRDTNSFERSEEPKNSRSRINTSEPGIGARLKIIKGDQPNIEELEEDDIEGMEQDFMNSRGMFKDHEREMQARNFRVGLKITERKHFKQPVEPNLLSWSEKEQIRNLHSEDRLIWTTEKLADGFPATEDIIQKVLHSSWKPSDVAKVRKHDEKVAENWKKFYAGELTIHNQNLRKHLVKFNRRNFLPNKTTDYSSYAVRSLPEPKTSEFSNIIESYKRLKLISEGDHSPQVQSIENPVTRDKVVEKVKSNENTYLERKIRGGLYTLDLLKKDVAKSMPLNKEGSETDRRLIKSYVKEENKRQSFDEMTEVYKNHALNTDKRRIPSNKEEVMDRSRIKGVGKKEEGLKENWRKIGEDEEKANRCERRQKFEESENFGSRNLIELRGMEDSFRVGEGDEKIIKFKLNDSNFENRSKKPRRSADSGVENRRESGFNNEAADVENETRIWSGKTYRSADLGVVHQNTSTLNNESAALENESQIWSGKTHGSAYSGVVYRNEGEKSRSTGKTGDLEVVNIGDNEGQVRSNVYESQFDGNSKSLPAKYSKEGNIIWEMEKKHAVDDIAYRIRIPKDKIKKGYLYKVNDCFYTHEGEFLYRVPGMT
ncbi:uncharacterized protein LOC111053337 [Nilaparvata lugens]|uniref:uncharacterized protein LOC111053337 n=1 Tax=Nilaparvata lugens TaxID=108931 RepID=UPI000B97E6FB|nr:uncharacterized protein LOC111053337 [Nilaparvata lugens]